MPSITVVVQEVDQNIRPGAKTGGVKGTDGTWYKIPLNMMGMVQPGGSYNFFYEDSNFNGKVYHMVKTINAAQQQLPIQQPVQQAPQYVPAPQTYAPAPQQAAPRMAAPPPFVPAVASKEELIFVCGIINNGVSSGNIAITRENLAFSITEAYLAWMDTYDNPNWKPSLRTNSQHQQAPQRQAGPPPSQRGDDMSDSIPFN